MRVGIMGTGIIAATMTRTIERMEGVSCVAVASRTLSKAEDYKKRYGLQKAYGSYEELAADDEVDLIYIATPHSEHRNNTIMALQHGRAVLCEKAFAVNEKEAMEMVALSREKKVYLAEAIWTRYMPYRSIVEDMIAAGKIGEVVSLSANLGYDIKGVQRIYDPALAGGALLDLGIYPLQFASMFLGDEITNITSSCMKFDTGVDATDGMILTYKSGKMAFLHCSAMGAMDQQGIIYGTKGYIVVERINNPVKVSVYDNARELVEEVTLPEQISGYEYEVLEAKRALEEGRIECDQAPLDVTVKLMRVMDKLRKEWGIKYPFE